MTTIDILANLTAGYVTTNDGALRHLVWVTVRPYWQYHPTATEVAALYSKEEESVAESYGLLPDWAEDRMGDLLKQFGQAKRAWQEEEQEWNWHCSRVDWFQSAAETHEVGETVFVFSYRWEEGLAALQKAGMRFIPRSGHFTMPEMRRKVAALAAARAA